MDWNKNVDNTKHKILRINSVACFEPNQQRKHSPPIMRYFAVIFEDGICDTTVWKLNGNHNLEGDEKDIHLKSYTKIGTSDKAI